MLVSSVNTGRQAPQTARDSFTLWANATPIKGLSIGGGAFYMSRVFGGYSDNRSYTQNAAGVTTFTPATKVRIVTVPEYWRFDARIGYTINEHFDVSVNVQNLTDKAPPIVLSGTNAVDTNNHNVWGRIWTFEISHKF